MTDRLKDALDAIAEEPRGFCFEKICVHLALLREPALIVGTGQNDGGQDAHLPDDSLSVGCSLTSTWGKVAADIERVQKRRPNLRTFWFYTYGNPGVGVTDRWIDVARKTYGVALVVFPGRDVLLRLEDPKCRFICEKYLPGVYPTGVIRLATRDDILSSLAGWAGDTEQAGQLLDELIQRAHRYPKDSDYTYLALSYFFLKAGPAYWQRYPQEYRQARNRLLLMCSRKKGPWKMPAYWTLARWLLAEVPSANSRSQAVQLTRQAHRLFGRVRPGSLPHQVLLPGVPQEFLPDEYEFATPDFDPVVDRIVIPHRYLATTRLNIAALSKFADRTYAHDISTYLAASGRLRVDAPRLRLNAMLVNIMTRCVSAAVGNEIGQIDSLDDQIKQARDGIEEAYAADDLSYGKKLEWQAALSASCACLTRSDRDHEDAFDEMLRNIQRYCRYTNRDDQRGIPDWLLNDPAYQTAAARKGPGSFAEIILGLQTDPTTPPLNDCS